MTLSWNEIKDRALKFSKEWAGTSNEEADAKPFLVEFFNVFGISSRRVSTFEHRVKKLDDKDGYIDLLWKGTILVEMKSRGKSLDKAYTQAKDYLHGLKDHELPKYILISDFENFRLHDLEDNKVIEFQLGDLVQNVQHFGYLLGYQKKVYKEQDPANIKAAELMGKLHDRLEEIGYTGHPLEVYLVRLLFCLFAEDTTIFNKQQFQDYIEQRTNIDGSDLAAKLQELFQVLNTPTDKRFINLDEQLAEFPYVNGALFEESLPVASFDTKMRQALLDCTYIDWSKISPAIFGSMFQSVMNPKERRNLGAHYTSETNILKVIKPLFLDELWREFEAVKGNRNKLLEFHMKLGTLKFLDPACGCGNFLVITYRELRLLELEILRILNSSGQTILDVRSIIRLDVDQFYGIEYEEFPARIAEVAMWLIDHQMNMMVSNEFGQYFLRLPLKKAANILHADALETDWELFVPKGELSYIIGNPPFIGTIKMLMSEN
jgi:type I restriction-modification system DNA methylase subunit